MRRKLISYDTFNRISENSLSNAGAELSASADLLAETLKSGNLELYFYNADSAFYETTDGNYIRADYKFNDGKISFKNIEEIVIDENSHRDARYKIINDMLEAVVENDDKLKATSLFRNLVEMSAPKMKFMKGSRGKSAVEKMASNIKEASEAMADRDIWGKNTKDSKKSTAAKEGHRNNPGSAKKGWSTRRKHTSKIEAEHGTSEWKSAKKKAKLYHDTGRKGARVRGKRYDEWNVVATNVLEYVAHHVNAPSMAKVIVENDNFDNIKSVVIPSSKMRNEGKLLALKYDTLKTDVKTLRESAQRLAIDENFQKSLLDIKRSNNLSDNENLEEAINALVSNFPSVLYLTQDELAKTVSEALEQAGQTNFDDQTCTFIAEGILRVAFSSYPERVAKLASLANANLHSAVTNEEDEYTVFQNAVTKFFPSVDEAVEVELQVFSDLHNVFLDVQRAAVETRSEILHKQATEYLNKFEQVLNGAARPSLSLAEEASAYLVLLDEGAFDMKPWEITKKPFRTTSGDHPQMAKNAAVGYTPSKDGSGDWGDVAPVSDGKSYRNGGAEEMRNRSWAQKGGKDVYPSLNNPVIPKAGEFTMPKEKGVDKECDSGLGQNQGSTWPVLSNPYLLQSVTPHVKSDNRVDD